MEAWVEKVLIEVGIILYGTLYLWQEGRLLFLGKASLPRGRADPCPSPSTAAHGSSNEPHFLIWLLRQIRQKIIAIVLPSIVPYLARKSVDLDALSLHPTPESTV